MPTKNAFPLLTATLLLALASCGRVPGQFVVIQNQAPLGACSIPADISAPYLPDGVLDVSLVKPGSNLGYVLFPLLENDLPPPTNGQLVDGNRIAISGFNVEIELANTGQSDTAGAVLGNNPTLTHYSLNSSGSVASGGGHTAASVNAFPAALALALRAESAFSAGSSIQVITRVQALGSRINGSIASDWFSYPLRLCDGCLVASIQTCPVVNSPANAGNPCNVAQDTVVDCCTTGGGLVCPSMTATQ